VKVIDIMVGVQDILDLNFTSTDAKYQSLALY
jgi:hypothetical protein